MYRSLYRYLCLTFFFLISSSTLFAYYNPSSNVPAAAPPNYNQIDSSYFMGTPAFGDYTPFELGGYYVFKDVELNRWNIVGVIWPGGQVYEQVHGSALVQMDEEPQAGVNVWPIGYKTTDDLLKNDRWGWVKWPESIAPGLYEIWWDYTIDKARLGNVSSIYDTIGFSFSGCAFDFNIWASGHFGPFTPDMIKLGENMIPITDVPGFTDTYPGYFDQYQGASSPKDPNTSTFSAKTLPGASYNEDGLIPTNDDYGYLYGGSRAYEGDGIEFSLYNCPPENPPYFDPPLGYLKSWQMCPGTTIYDTIIGVDPDEGDILTIELISGLGTLTSTPSVSPAYGYYSWTPAGPGSNRVVYRVFDSHGLSYVDSVTYEVIFNQPPELMANDTTLFQCYADESICLEVGVSDYENDPITLVLISGPGNINPETGIVCFTPDGPGVYDFVVEASDSCGTATVDFSVTVEVNGEPYLNPFDTIVNLCVLDSICFDISAFDPDLGDSLEITHVSGPGSFIQTGNGVGRQCFWPDDIDSARYVFYYSVTDDCMREPAVQAFASATTPIDSAVVIVILNQAPTVICPENQIEFLCLPQTLCYQITAENPGGDQLTYELISGPGSIDPVTGEICFTADTEGTFTFTASVSDECGSDTCSFDVTVYLNQPPDVQISDTTLFLCEPAEICLPVDIGDVDGNIVDITVSEPGWYNDANGTVCIFAEASGVYELTVTVTDECGLSMSLTGIITVYLNSPPEVVLPPDTALFYCQPGEVCIDGISITDADNNISQIQFIPDIGVYSDGSYCFTADTVGQYCIVARVTDDCGEVAEDTICIDFELGSSVSIDCPPEIQVVDLCQPDSVCLAIGITPGDAVVSVIGEGAVYVNGQLCFFAGASGRYEFTLVASGDCGSDSCTVIFDVTLGEAPQLTCPPSDSISLCAPDYISLPLGVLPPDAQVTITPATAEYVNGQIRFYADTSGEYCFTVEATTSCGTTQCQFCISVTIDSPPTINIEDSTIALCFPEQVCLPFEFFDPDDNIVTVVVQSQKYEIHEGWVCFTPEVSGTNEIILTVIDSCGNSDVDTAYAHIELNQGPTVTVGDTSVFICEKTDICLPVNIIDPDGIIDSVIVDDPAWYDDVNQTICLAVSETGDYTIEIIVYDDCGIPDTATASITAIFNSPPVVTVPSDTTIFRCLPEEICLDGFGLFDVDDNITETILLPTPNSFENGTYCFTPDTAGTYCIIYRAIDDCGAVTEDTVCVQFELGEAVVIECPTEIQQQLVCQPQEVCFDIPVLPPDAVVSVIEPDGRYENGRLCFNASESGIYTFTLVASNECFSDTCRVSFDITVGNLPQLTCPEPSAVHLCGPDSISVPLTFIPVNASLNIDPEASYDNGQLTFYADTAGQYCFAVTATTECGSDQCSFCVTVTFDQPPTVIVPDTLVFLCEPAEICLPVTVLDLEDNITNVSVEPEAYQVIDGQICFTPDVSGSYQFIVTAIDSCGNITSDAGTVTVDLNDPPQVTVDDTTLFICGPTDICLPIQFSDLDGNIDSIVVTAPGWYDADSQSACINVDQAGTYDIYVTVYDGCQVTATDMATITVTLNTEPGITIGEYPDPITLCQLEEVCIPVFADDFDGNLLNVYAEGDCSDQYTYNSDTETLCWTPTAFGTCSLTVMAEDDCGAISSITLEITILELPLPDPVCPNDTTVVNCMPGNSCIDVGYLGHNPTVQPADFIYDSLAGTICYPAYADRIDTVYVIDSTECGIDSCFFVITTVLNDPPEIIGEAQTTINFCNPFIHCFPVDITDPEDNLDRVILKGSCPPAFYDEENGQVCVNIAESIDCELLVIAIDYCGAADTLAYRIIAEPNRPPEISLPTLETVVRCETDTTSITILDICVTDADYNQVELVLDSGLGDFYFDAVEYCAAVTFKPPSNDSAVYCFRFRANDYCDTVYQTYCLTVLPTPVCSTCVEISIVGPDCVSPGAVTAVNLIVETKNEVAAYDLLIAYDGSVLNFLRADAGAAIGGWEFFTYRYGPDGNCEGSCPSGLLRLVAIADINDGPNHPPPEQFLPEGTIASMTFRVSTNQSYGGMNIPISFFWYDCGDNSFSDPSGQYQLIDQKIFHPEGSIIWDEFNDDAYPESSRWPFIGAPDECLSGDKEIPVRCIDFHNGDLCIIHPDSIDDRGDLNLNGISYEIADAVVYSNYFLFGLDAFTISIPAQIAASDVNADGRALSIADLVYLIRVVTGDALPYAKQLPTGNKAKVNAVTTADKIKLTVDSPYDIGAILLTFEYEGMPPEDPVAASSLAGMNVKHAASDDNRLRVLIYSFEADHKIASGERDIIEIAFGDAVGLELMQIEMVDYYGRSIETDLSASVLPGKLELSQNFPNPFNPSTSFELALPTAADYQVNIYNIVGQTIRDWSGHSEAGLVRFEWDGTDFNGNKVASGIYFYRATALGSEAIRKMILLK